MQIWDTAGQEKYRSIVQTYYKGATGIILVYSVNDRKSFHNVDSWMKQIKANAAENVLILLVANKRDVSESDRQVEKEEGQRVAAKYCIDFFETSAKEGINVVEAFLNIAKQIKDQFAETAQKSPDMSPIMIGGQKLHIPLHEIDKQKEIEAKSGCRC